MKYTVRCIMPLLLQNPSLAFEKFGALYMEMLPIETPKLLTRGLRPAFLLVCLPACLWLRRREPQEMVTVDSCVS